MKKTLWPLLAVFCPILASALPVLKTSAAPTLTHKTHFFEGSTRSDLTPEQAPFLVQLHLSARAYAAAHGYTDSATIAYVKEALGDKPTCTGFFVRNSQGKFLIGSSRHCFLFNEQKFIETGDLTVRAFATGSPGRVTRIAITDPKSDFFIFEADFGPAADEVRAKTSGLIPSIMNSPEREELAVFGFPGDDERQGRPTLSANCHSFPSKYDPEGKNFYMRQMNKEASEENKKSAERQQEKFAAAPDASTLIFQNMWPIRHNCNIYGGNSGGPAVLAKHPHILAGIPATYAPTMAPFGRDDYGLLESPYWLLLNHEDKFKDEGIPYLMISQPASQLAP